jgi:hypothetical protein
MNFPHLKRHEIVEIIHDNAMLLFSDEAEDVAWWHFRGKVPKRWRQQQAFSTSFRYNRGFYSHTA